MTSFVRSIVFALVLSTAVSLVSCSEPSGRRTLIDNLSAPRGLTALEDGSLLVSEVGTGRLLRVDSAGDSEVLVSGLPTTLDSGPGGNYPSGLGAVLPHGHGYALLVGEFIGDRFARLYLSDADGDFSPITPPTSLDLPAGDRFSNPYDFVEVPDGWLVSDSGRNAVIHVSGDGTVGDYALFDRIPLQGYEQFTETEVVPTGIALGPDGAAYVSTLTGYPYPQGEARIYRIVDSNHDGDAMDLGEVTVYASGFSTATDLVFDSDGALLVTEFSTDMRQLIEEFGIGEAKEVPGRLVRWKDGEISIVAEDLVSPTSVAVARDNIYVSEEFAGRVIRVR